MLQLMIRFCLSLCALIFFSLSAALAQDSSLASDDEKIRVFLNFLSNINRYSPMEGAGSHGSYGTHLGLGISSYELQDANSLHKQLLKMEDSGKSERLNLAKLYILKGTDWPLDLGVNASNLPGTDVIQYGGHIQWTILESLDFPALASRLSYSAFAGMPDVIYRSVGLDLITSYGFLRYFTLFGGFGWQHNRIEMRYQPNQAKTSLLNQDDYVSEFKRSETSFHASQIYGLRIVVLPPFISISGEILRSKLDLNSYSLKAAFLF